MSVEFGLLVLISFCLGVLLLIVWHTAKAMP